jgi:rRNA maturation RNase YbeY
LIQPKNGNGHIDFIYLNVSLPGFVEERARDWIVEVVRKEGRKAGSLTYVFCDDDYLLNLNKTYLNHDTLTDIITFDYSKELGNISGDMFISVPTVTDNAGQLGVSFEAEMHRVIIHGLLHLLGYNDKEGGERALMRDTENYYLSLLF